MREILKYLQLHSDVKVQYFDGGKLAERTFAELANDVYACAARLSALGIRARARIGLIAENSYQWVVHDLALIELDAISFCIPVDSPLASTLKKTVSDYGLDALLVSSAVAKHLEDGVCAIVLGEDKVRGGRPIDTQGGASLDSDLFTVVFSSGSSGRLKALLVSKKGTLAMAEGFGDTYDFQRDDAILAFLPLSAFQQRWMVFAAIRYGFCIQIADAVHLFKAFKEMKPTIFGAPPLFYEGLENRLLALPLRKRAALVAASTVITALFPRAVANRMARWLFASLHEALGGRLRLLLTGAAPTRISTIKLLRRTGLPLYEGYGLTETGYISLNLPGQDRVGSVGKPLSRANIRFADDGEIITHWDAPLTLGYLNVDAEEARKTYVSPGVIATGDLGYLDEDGFLHVRGRKKEVLITRGGEKLHPESIEKEVEKQAWVGRAVVLANEGDEGTCLVVALRLHTAPPGAQEVRRLLDRLNRTMPKGLHFTNYFVTNEPFSVDNGMLTRNLKIDRRAIWERFKDQREPLVAQCAE